MQSVRVRTIFCATGGIIELSTSDKPGMVQVHPVCDGFDVAPIDVYFGSFLAEINSAQSGTPPLGLPLGRGQKVLKERKWAVFGSPQGETHARIVFIDKRGRQLDCDVPIAATCQLVENVAAG